MPVLLIESLDYKKFIPITSSKPIWDVTCGIFTPYQRYKRQFHDINVYSLRFEEEPFSFLKEELLKNIYHNPNQTINTVVNAQYIPSENLSPQMKKIAITKEGKFIYLHLEEIKLSLIERIINNDISALLTQYPVIEIESGIYLNDLTDIIKNNSKAIEYDSFLIKNDTNFISPENRIYIDKTARIQQYVSLQPDNGPIIIDKGAQVRSFSLIDGPSYIGKNSLIDSGKIRSGTTIKDVCRIGGEVESSIVENYSNKHHEGFLGHSYAGEWVNIGAMATTSDLKNNYGNIRIKIKEATIDTGTNKFGSIIGDYTKIGIGTMLNTGTVISQACNLFSENGKLPAYTPPFSWGSNNKYDIDRFIDDTRKIMLRRNVELSEAKEKFLRSLYKRSI